MLQYCLNRDAEADLPVLGIIMRCNYNNLMPPLLNYKSGLINFKPSKRILKVIGHRSKINQILSKIT